VENISFKTLSLKEIKQIIDTSIKILKDVGVKVLDEDLKAVIKELGLSIDTSNIVKLNEDLIFGSLNYLPRYFDIYDFNGKRMELNRGYTFNACCTLYAQVIDYKSGKLTGITMQDHLDLLRICDSIDNYDLHHSVEYPYADNKSENWQILEIEAQALNCTKHVLLCPIGVQSVKLWKDVSEILMEGVKVSEKPAISVIVTPKSPLVIGRDTADLFLYCIKHKIPMIAGREPLMGATTPVTIAGTLVTMNAEFLFMNTIAQMIKKGTKIIHGCGAVMMDLRTGVNVSGSVENYLIDNASKQISDFYNMPSYTAIGFPDSLSMDFQSGYETLAGLFGVMGNCNDIIYGYGSIAAHNGVCAEKLIMDSELYEIVNRFNKGIVVNEDSLAFDVIKKVGPGGHFMAEDHTLSWARKEYYYPTLPVRVGTGIKSKTMFEKAHDKVEELLSCYKPKIKQSIAIEIKDYVKERLI
jgi:trimethylamine---corrinoid protein Co-methyltransferase